MLKIKDLREDRDLLQKEMAEKLNVSQTNYSKYELGKINIPIETLKKMAYVIGYLEGDDKVSKQDFNNILREIIY